MPLITVTIILTIILSLFSIVFVFKVDLFFYVFLIRLAYYLFDFVFLRLFDFGQITYFVTRLLAVFDCPILWQRVEGWNITYFPLIMCICTLF